MIAALIVLNFMSGLVLSAFCANGDASLQLAAADKAVGEAFDAVREADSVNANVSLLVDRLNVSSRVLADAHEAFRLGNYTEAESLASQCINLVSDVVSQAASIRNQANRENEDRLLLTTSMSSVGIGALSAFGIIGWHWLRRRYVKRALGSKPEVASTG